MKKAERAVILLERLPEMYPDARCLLEYGGDPSRLLIATILSARTTDNAVNRVTPILWKKFPTIGDLAVADRSLVEDIVHPLGFFRSKARSIQEAAAWVQAGGAVPGSMDQLTRIPGVGRKTASVVLGEVFGIPAVIVDTHVGRLSNRLDLSRMKDPDKIEQSLRRLIPRNRWISFSHQLGFHGRKTCTSRKPACSICELADICPRRGMG